MTFFCHPVSSTLRLGAADILNLVETESRVVTMNGSS
jgi:hypothetical protein